MKYHRQNVKGSNYAPPQPPKSQKENHFPIPPNHVFNNQNISFIVFSLFSIYIEF